MTRYCLGLDEIGLDDVPRVGGKTASLGEMAQHLASVGIDVPPGFAITADAFSAVLSQGDARAKLYALLSDFDARDPDQLAERGHAARRLVLDAGLTKRPILRRKIGDKHAKIVYGRRGGPTTCSVPVSEGDRRRRSFSDEDALTLARWAVANRGALLCASRAADPDGHRVGQGWRDRQALHRPGAT